MDQIEIQTLTRVTLLTWHVAQYWRDTWHE